MNLELPDVQADFRKGRGTRHQIADIHLIIEKGRKFQKKKDIYFCFIGKAFDVGRDWGQEEKGTTEDEMAGWHH